ncbi:MAG TPA: response regulator [Candidatus Kapabacteria bacterium]|jgi:response regulator RpfG family c-di-GMP phosphodiesterase|nr:response regulator [Ignavibacteria bacterium]HRE56280.1 response regulator [Candidatus Kapabacteria bacterium]HRK59134.1 response regulator [Candidatus Kapabacteria bacterium]
MKHKKLKVLVVDRHATMQLLVRHQLEKSGYEVIIAETKEQAASAILSGEVLCIVGSYNHEEYGCLALSRKLHCEPYNLDVPCVFYSTIDKEMVNLQNSKVEYYLQMPFSMDQFNSVIKQVESKFQVETLRNFE